MTTLNKTPDLKAPVSKTTPKETPPRCDKMLGQDAGLYVRCVLGPGHTSHHIGYGPRGDIQSVTWVPGDSREETIPPPGEGPAVPPEPLTPQQKLVLLAAVLTPNLPEPPA